MVSCLQKFDKTLSASTPRVSGGDDARSARAEALAIEIADDEDRALVHADIAAEPWFGVDGD